MTLCVSFSKVLILFRFDLISSSSNLSWHFLYTRELSRCLFANLKRRNYGITPFFLQSNKSLKSKWHFRSLNSRFSNIRIFLTKASLHLFLIVSAIDFPLGNLIQMINKKTKPIIVTIMLTLKDLLRNTFH